MSADDGLEPLPASLARTWGNTETPRNWTAAIDAAGDAMGNTETMEGRMNEDDRWRPHRIAVWQCPRCLWRGLHRGDTCHCGDGSGPGSRSFSERVVTMYVREDEVSRV